MEPLTDFRSDYNEGQEQQGRQTVTSGHRARDILNAVSRAYPRAWKQYDVMRATRDHAVQIGVAWPNWCYAPALCAQSVIRDHLGINQLARTLDPLPIEMGRHVAIINAFAAWRLTQGIYRFDAALYEALLNTPIEHDFPLEPFYRLPEWCVYIETPGPVFSHPSGAPIRFHGFWASVLLFEDHEHYLTLVVDNKNPNDAMTLDGGCTLIAFRIRALGDAGDRFTLPPGEPWMVEGHRKLLSLVLYLCAEDADIAGDRAPCNPQPIKTKRGPRLFPAQSPTTWDVGVRLGAALRAAYRREQTESDATPTGRNVRPHVRRAHWHTFLAGPRDGERERRVRWLPPIAVKVEDPTTLPAVVRPVKQKNPRP